MGNEIVPGTTGGIFGRIGFEADPFDRSIGKIMITMSEKSRFTKIFIYRDDGLLIGMATPTDSLLNMGLSLPQPLQLPRNTVSKFYMRGFIPSDTPIEEGYKGMFSVISAYAVLADTGRPLSPSLSPSLTQFANVYATNFSVNERHNAGEATGVLTPGSVKTIAKFSYSISKAKPDILLSFPSISFTVIGGKQTTLNNIHVQLPGMEAPATCDFLPKTSTISCPLKAGAFVSTATLITVDLLADVVLRGTDDSLQIQYGSTNGTLWTVKGN